MAASVPYNIGYRGQVALIVLVVLIGIGGTALGALNVRSSIFDPYEYTNSGNEQLFAHNLGGSDSVLQDTDGDGLTDNEELNTYGTSPYLADSDSDGISDADEIRLGNNPNCPQGTNCDFELNSSGTVDLPATQLGSSGTASVTASQLRDILREEGVSEEQLNSLSDKELLAAYNQAISQQSVNEANVSRDYTNLTVDEIRELLVGQGIEQSILDELSDDQIVELYQEAVASINSN